MFQKLRVWRQNRRQVRESESLAQRVQRRARRIIFTVLALLALTCLTCFLMALFVGRASAQVLVPPAQVLVPPAQETPGAHAGGERLDVLLVIDNSNSMFDKAGIGSDPELRRIEAARLFIHYQGVDSGMTDHRLGVIFFGGTARTVVPLTLLDYAERRAEIAGLIASPVRMQWTDPVAALALARETLTTDSVQPGARVVVLLTDGKPEWDNSPTTAERASVVADLEALGRAYARDEIALFVILLENAATDADPEIAQVYVPLWKTLTTATRGRFYAVREADALIDVYHDVLLALSGGITAGTVVDAHVAGERQVHTIEVEPALRRVTFVVRVDRPLGISDPSAGIAVALARPNGRPLRPDDAGVRHAAYGTTAIWAIDRPVAGIWTVEIAGRGSVTVWKDYVREPAPVPVATPTATPAPAAPPSPAPTATPAPTLHVLQWPPAALFGAPITLSVALLPMPASAPELWVTWQAGGMVPAQARLLDDGRAGDARGGDGRYTAVWTSPVTGTIEAHAWVEVAGQVLDRWDGRAAVEPVPRLHLATPHAGQVWRAGEPAPVIAGWRVGDGTPVAAGGTLDVTIEDSQGAVVTVVAGQAGKPMSVPAPTVAGTYTLTVQAAAMTPSQQRFTDRLTVLVRVRRPAPLWAIGAGVAGLVTLAGGWHCWHWYRRIPRLAGKLRVLAAPATYQGERCLDLSALNQRKLLLGARGIFPLASLSGPWAELHALTDGSGVAIAATGLAQVQVNRRTVYRNLPLADGDLLQVGEFKLRYECL